MVYLSNRTLTIFGSITYAHVLDQKQIKLDDKSEKYVFIGYDSSSKGYKLYNPSNEKVISSRDVVFDEESTWDWKKARAKCCQDKKPISLPRSPNHEGPSSSSEESPSERPHRMKSLQELYKMSENQNDLTLFCLFSDCELIGFEEAVQRKK